MDKHTPFLQYVARTFVRNYSTEELSDICFVFPNKRSITFFLRYLDEEMLGNAHIEPPTTTISDFVASLSPLAEATRYEQLFTLYTEYRKLSAEVSDFDRFQFWGEMILSDFNDVDRQLADPQKLFRNVKEFREMNSTYLTDEQLEVIRQYWGEEFPADYSERFWTHIEKDGVEKPHRKFLSLWEVLSPLYDNFMASLKKKGLATSGFFYRNAAASVRDTVLPRSKYVFVGFNVLSTSELKIFERLKARGIADFYWDFNSPAFKLERNKANRFLRENVRLFKSQLDTEEPEITTMPDIEIIGVPSNVGQTHVAGDIVERLAAHGDIVNPANAIDTAIVLTDETLFLQMIEEIPPSVSTMNVTMGYPMRLTPIAALMKSVVALQRNVRKTGGRYCFFYEHVLNLLASPILRTIAPESCKRLVDLIHDRHLFNIDAEMIKRDFPEIAAIFQPIRKSGDLDDAAGYITELLDFLEKYTSARENIERIFITAYRQELHELIEACRIYSITMRESTMLGMIDRAIASASVPLTGEPLRGIQIMGVLETRSLDFDNVIMLSMNETIFPRKQFKRSFIPESLRRGYGLSTADYAESVYAYYFYRLLSRARKVTLIYDARTVGMRRNNEMSRYLSQLMYLFPNAHISHSTTYFNVSTFEEEHIEIKKTPEVMKLLDEYLRPDGSKRLSASALNGYLSCPLNFYLEQVEGLRFPDTLNDYMDYSTYGTIVHEVMENIYKDIVARKGSNMIQADDLDQIISSQTIVDRYVTQSVNRHFIRLDDEKLDSPLNGEALVMHHVMVAIVRQLLRVESRSVAPFEFVDAERKIKGQLKVNNTLTVNFTQTIDRIDRVNGRLRFVDYKTGSDTLDASNMDKLFNHEAHAIFQLMLYCHFYAQATGNNEPIQHIIYKTRDLFIQGIRPLTFMKSPIVDYHSLIDEFTVRLNEVISEIFNPEIPFRQAKDKQSCKFCKFTRICKMDEN